MRYPIRFIAKKIYLVSLANLLYLFTARGQSASILIPRMAVSHHQGIYHDLPVHYTALVKEYYLNTDSSTSPGASVITTSYLKDDSVASADRPVLFVFNGGPGASSSPLHLNAFGPWRIQHLKDTSILIENPYCLLDATDLVFIDPPGTGFTRVVDDKSAAGYWTVEGDAQLFIDIIKKWKKETNRYFSPVFLCGESYGTTRAAEMLGIAKDLPISGVVFLSSLFDLSIVTPAPGNDMPYILYLPGMAAVAWYHHKQNQKINSPEQAYAEAIHFAQHEYISALALGLNLTTKERDLIATKLSNLTGLSIQTLLEKNLRVTPKDFQLLLLAKEGKRIGQLNGQITGPLINPGVKPPFDDPSMSFNPSTRALVAKYFNQTLKFSDSIPYKTLNLEVNRRWNWSTMEEDIGYWTVAPYLLKALKEQPHLKMLVAGGYYDLATPLYAARYILEHIGVPPNRVTYANFPTGHSIFEKEEELKKLSNQIRSFITNK